MKAIAARSAVDTSHGLLAVAFVFSEHDCSHFAKEDVAQWLRMLPKIREAGELQRQLYEPPAVRGRQRLHEDVMKKLMKHLPAHFESKNPFYDVRLHDYAGFIIENRDEGKHYDLADPSTSRVVMKSKGTSGGRPVVVYTFEKGICNLDSLATYLGHIPDELAENALVTALTADQLCWEKNKWYLPQLDLKTIFVRPDLSLFVRTFPLRKPKESGSDAWNELRKALKVNLHPSKSSAATRELLNVELAVRGSTEDAARVISDVQKRQTSLKVSRSSFAIPFWLRFSRIRKNTAASKEDDTTGPCTPAVTEESPAATSK